MTEKKGLIKVKDLSFYYDGIPVLDNVNLQVFEKDFLGIIGPNGGGKTTLLKLMLGLLKPTNGEIEILGGVPESSRGKIGYVPQYSHFDESFPINVIDTVLMSFLGRKKAFRWFTRSDKELALRALEKLKIADFAYRPVGKLSYGQRQRVFIARAILTDPVLLFLDEPTASVDTTMQESFYKILSELKKSMAIILVTHDITAVSRYVGKIGCLNKKLFYHGSKEIRGEDIGKVYGCPVDLIAHGTPHRVMKGHK